MPTTVEDGVSFLVEEGAYHVTVHRSGADPVTSTTVVTVRGGETTSTDVSLPAPSPKRFRVEVTGEAIWQRRELDGSFVIARSRENVTLDPVTTSPLILSHDNRTQVTSLDERGRLELGWVKFFYRVAQWLEVHVGVGTGRLATRVKNLAGQESFSTEDKLFDQKESFTSPFTDSASHRDSGNQGWAFQAGSEATLYRTPNPLFSVVLSGRWAYLESDDILTIAQGVEIDESHTHLLDVGVKGRLQRERFGMHAGIKTIWLWTEYEGRFENIESFRVFGTPAPYLTRTKKERFSFDVEPKTFPILGVLGVDYAITNSFGVQLEGAAGNSRTYSVTGGAFYRW